MSSSRTNGRVKAFTILLVDDDPDWRALIRDSLVLAQPDCDVRELACGQEALDYLRRRGGNRDSPRPDMIVLDMQMPDLGGRQTLRAVKSDPQLKDIPVVVLTGVDEEGARSWAYRHGAERYLLKPAGRVCRVQTLLNCLNRWVRHHRLGGKESAA